MGPSDTADRLAAIGVDRIAVRHEADDGIVTYRVFRFYLPS